MYRVLIVDDEEPARETLRYIIDWEETDFCIVGMAKNGKEALASCETLSPDLIITDIQMPVMDGLELIKTVKSRNKEQKFVILSCHENFHYAKEAIHLGVSDYLLKDLLTPVDLYGLLEKIRLEIEEEAKGRQKDSMDRNQEAYLHQWKQSLLKKLVLEDHGLSMDEKKQAFSGDAYIMMSISIDDYYLMSQQQTNMMALRHRALERMNKQLMAVQGECFYDEKGCFVAIAAIEKSKSEYTYIKHAYEIGDGIHKALRDMSITVTIGVSGRFFDLQHVRKGYEEAKTVVQHRVFLGKGKTILYNIQRVKGDGFNMGQVEKHLQDMRGLLAKSDFDGMTKRVYIIYRKDITGFVQYHYLKYIHSRLLGLILEYCTEKGIALKTIFGCSYVPMEKLEALDTLEDMTLWFIELIDHMASQKVTGSDYSKHVQNAINYIHRHSKKKINLTYISEELSLNKAYLCRLFKQEVGETLTDYINKVRIQDAKELIRSTQYKMYEIAEYVGFTNIQHFNSTFKKITGENPMYYRR